MPKVATRVDVGALLAHMASPSSHDGPDSRILAAARRELFARGLGAFEVDDVAAASGVGRSTIYRRFSGRNELIAAALAEQGRRFLGALADGVQELERIEDQGVGACAGGLRVARQTGLGDLVRSEPLLLRLFTIDSAPLVAAACDQLVTIGRRRVPTLDPIDAQRKAEVLVRLAISFVITPESSIVDSDVDIERAIRPVVASLLAD